MDGQCKTSSSFMKEIRTLPVVQAMEDLYTSSKQSSGVLSTGLAVVEYSLGSLSSRFYSSLGKFILSTNFWILRLNSKSFGFLSLF